MRKQFSVFHSMINMKDHPSWFCFVIAFLFLTTSLWAQGLDGISEAVKVKEASQSLSQSQITEKITRLKIRIKTAQKATTDQTQSGAPFAELNERVDKLSALLSVYERLLIARKKASALEEEAALLHEKLQGEQVGIKDPPPYHLSFYDAILDELATVQQEKEGFSLSVKLSKRTLEDILQRLESTQKDERRLKELRDIEPDQGDSQTHNWDLEKAGLEKEYLESLLSLEKAGLDNLVKSAGISDQRIRLLQRKTSWVRKHLHDDDVDFAKQSDALKNEKDACEKEAQEIIQKQEKAEKNWMTVLRESSNPLNGKPDRVQKAYLNRREAWHVTYQTMLGHLENQIQLLDHQAQVWKFRYDLIKGDVQHKEIRTRQTEIQKHLQNLGRILDIERRSIYNNQSKIISLEKADSAKDVDPLVRPHLKSHIKALQRLSEKQLEYINTLLTTERADKRFLDEVSLKLKKVNLGQRMTDFKEWLWEIWDYEFFAIDNHPVTVHKLVVAFIILVMGIIIAKFVLIIFTRRVFSVMRLHETTASALEKMLTYSAYLLVVLFALRMVNIPLTAFAFVGGAIAIGVGFGAQNLINNFISGFIMMAERPISIGDLVEVEGILGKVEEIGARCTRVRTGENIHILVPNSSLLEKNITNWTLSDRQIRAKVIVGVIYGSPVREVERLLLQAVKENEKIIKVPEPFVIFSDFGDNALIFEIYFWIHVINIIERKLIESSVRFRIDELFREADIVIAFPQRDVHLDADKPLEFRLINPEESTDK